jgi:hypothetical protein
MLQITKDREVATVILYWAGSSAHHRSSAVNGEGELLAGESLPAPSSRSSPRLSVGALGPAVGALTIAVELVVPDKVL